jgi:uncharacterized membrane protein YdbT with pleckstrin-like domain
MTQPPKLNAGETAVFTAQPAAWSLLPAYVLTLGLFEISRRATWFVVTDQRVIKARGIVTRSERAIPVDMVQDATVRTQIGVGTVTVSSAGGGRLSAERFGPLPAATARMLASVILEQRQRARTQWGPGPASP